MGDVDWLHHLTDDLRRPPWRGSENHLAGHCYVASEVAYHLLGGKASEYTPQVIRHEGSQHWFLKNKSGRIIDLTAEQFDSAVPYDRSRGCGFLTRGPSKRAQIVLDRIASDEIATEQIQVKF